MKFVEFALFVVFVAIFMFALLWEPKSNHIKELVLIHQEYKPWM